MPTIAELEAAYDAAVAAEKAAINTREAMKDLLAALLKVDDVRECDCLPAEVREAASRTVPWALIEDLRSRIAAAKIEIERLEDARSDAGCAFAEAPEEAA